MYEWLGGIIRLVVIRQLALEEHNAPLHLFNAQQAQVQFAQQGYELRSNETSQFIHELFDRYRQEGISMVFTMDDFLAHVRRKFVETKDNEKRAEIYYCASLGEQKKMRELLPPEERQEFFRYYLEKTGLDADPSATEQDVADLLNVLSPDKLAKIIESVAPEAIKKNGDPEKSGRHIDDMSDEEIEEYLRKRKAQENGGTNGEQAEQEN